LDGDQIEKSKKWRCVEKLAFLPFKKAPEFELLTAIQEKPAVFAKAIGRTREQVEDALNASEGDDAHDRFVALARSINATNAELGTLAFRYWLKAKSGRKKIVKRLALDLAAKMKIALPD
jgi:hypothetical protein